MQLIKTLVSEVKFYNLGLHYTFIGLFFLKIWGVGHSWKPIKIWVEGVAMYFDLGEGGSVEFKFGGGGSTSYFDLGKGVEYNFDWEGWGSYFFFTRISHFVNNNQFMVLLRVGLFRSSKNSSICSTGRPETSIDGFFY